MKPNFARLSPAAAALAGMAILFGFAVLGPLAPPALAGTKTLSGKLRDVQDKVLTIEEKKTLATALVEVEMDSRTKVTGELVPGMVIKLKYFEEKAPAAAEPAGKNDGETRDKEAVRRIAIQVKTWPEYSSRRDRKAAPVTQP
jgi:hypothetical protein